MNLSNQFLIALPDMADPRFKQSVILICEHNQDGAMGLVVNAASDIRFDEVLKNLKMHSDHPIANKVHEGGPVHPECGFVLHRSDKAYQSSLQIGEDLKVTTSTDIIEDIAEGSFESPWLFCLGCAGWDSNQLEEEIQHNAWLTHRADSDIIFSQADESKWQQALALLGVEAHQLSSDFGHA